jgi:hypothetical protein
MIEPAFVRPGHCVLILILILLVILFLILIFILIQFSFDGPCVEKASAMDETAAEMEPRRTNPLPLASRSQSRRTNSHVRRRHPTP